MISRHERIKDEMEACRFIKTLSASFCALIALGIVAAYILDPFQIFHRSYFFENRYLDNERYQNAGLINRQWVDAACCDTLILGSSMSQNFSPSQTRKDLGGRGVLNLAMSAGLPIEADALLKAVLAKGPAPKTVIWEMLLPYNASAITPLNEAELLSKKPGRFFPAYLYDQNLWNDWRYLLSIDVYTNFLRGLFSGGKSFENVQSWYATDNAGFGHGENLFNQQKSHMTRKEISDYPGPFPNVTHIVETAVNEHPDIEFKIFFPPLSSMFYAVMYQKEYAKNLAFWRFTVQRLARYPNVEIYAFDTIFPETGDLNRYKDLRHHDVDVSQKIIRFISQRRGILTPQNIDDHLMKMTKQINAIGKYHE